jgi:hypothetical protein
MPAWTLLLVAALGAPGLDAQVQTLGGETVSGAVLKLDDQQITLKTADGEVSLETDKLLSLAAKSPPAAAEPLSMWVELVDGTQLPMKDYSVKDGQARMALDEGDIEAPTRDIAAVRLQASSDIIDAQWTKLLEEKIDADLLIVRKGESLDYHKGVLHNVTDKIIEFTLDGEVLPVKREKVFGLMYRHPAGRELPPSRCGLRDATGSHWLIRTMSLEGDRLKWTTPTDVTVSRPLASITRIDFSEGKVLFLSDLRPESVTWTPFFGTGDKLPLLREFFSPRQDRALESKPLRLGNKQYAKGLAVHSRTEMVYRLPGRFRRLEATVGIDESVRPRGNVRLEIRADDRVLLEKAITGEDAPLPINLDISGAARLTILVDFGEDLDVADHLDLCEARIIK